MMIGCHVRYNDGCLKSISEHIETADSYGVKINAIQIFAIEPTGWKQMLTPDDINDLGEYFGSTDDSRPTLYIHGSYVNYIYNQRPQNTGNAARELIIGSKIHAKGVIIHLSRKPIDIIINAVRSVYERLSTSLGKLSKDEAEQIIRNLPKIYLETNTAKPNDDSYETPMKLRKLYEEIYSTSVTIMDTSMQLKDLVGLTIDTSHVHASGYDIRGRKKLTEYLAHIEIIRNMGFDIMFHLNDSKHPLGSAKDVHMSLFDGVLFGPYKHNPRESGLYDLLKYCEETNTPAILERKALLCDDASPCLTNDFIAISKLIRR